MKIKILLLAVLSMGLFNAQEKKGILVVSFGTSYPEARKLCIESIENDIVETFEKYEVHRAFTSKIIRKKLKQRDWIEVLSPSEALDKMSAEGFKEVYVQSLHVLAGHEYHEIIKTIAKARHKFKKLKIGKPLLFSGNDYDRVIHSLEHQTEKFPGKTVVFVGHGSSHPSNASYSQLQNMMQDHNIDAYIATLGGYPELSDLLKTLKRNKIKKVVLMPLMIVAGDHAKNDIASDEEGSWKTILKSAGIDVEIYLHGLGENEDIRRIFVENIKNLIDGKPLFEEHHYHHRHHDHNHH